MAEAFTTDQWSSNSPMLTVRKMSGAVASWSTTDPGETDESELGDGASRKIWYTDDRLEVFDWA